MENSSSVLVYLLQHKSQHTDLSPPTQVTEAMVRSLRSMLVRVKQNKEDKPGTQLFSFLHFLKALQ